MKELDQLVGYMPSVKTADLKVAYEDTVNTIHALWENSPSDDKEGREQCYRELHGGRAFILRLMQNLKERANG